METDTMKPSWFGEKYILLDLLGTGGMAEVYRGKLVGDRGFEKLIVIKRLLAQAAKNPDLVAHFTAEARLAALLQHENIVSVYDFGRIGDSYFIAMEYLFGKDLYSLMQVLKERQVGLPVEYALMIAAEICEAMAYAHRLSDLKDNPLNIIHRDLTPQNIFVTYEGKIKVIDFGIAKTELHDNLTRVGVVKGKISYMSPEQLRGDRLDLRSDIFSIGILLYEMLSGRRMYVGDTAALVRKAIQVEYDVLEKVKPGLAPGIYRMLHRVLAADPDERYQNCDEMFVDITSCLGSMSIHRDSRRLKGFMINNFSKQYQREKASCTRMIAAAEQLESACSAEIEKTQIYTFDVAADRGRERTEVPKGVEKRFVLPDFLIFMQNRLSELTPKQKLTGAFAILLLVILSFIVSGQKKTTLNELPDVAVMKAVSPDAAEYDQEIQNRPEREKDAVAALLKNAEQALAAGNLREPEGASAFYYFRQIENVDPGNHRVQDGLKTISDRYAQWAENMLNSDDFLQAAKLIRDGLEVYPGSARLEGLSDRLHLESRQFVLELMNRAELCLAGGRLTTPEDDCALHYFQQILELDENNKTAHKGLSRIGDHYAVLADEAFRELEIDTARHYVDVGLKIVPDHWRLKLLHRDLQRSKPGLFFKSMEKNIKTLVP